MSGLEGEHTTVVLVPRGGGGGGKDEQRCLYVDHPVIHDVCAIRCSPTHIESDTAIGLMPDNPSG